MKRPQSRDLELKRGPGKRSERAGGRRPEEWGARVPSGTDTRPHDPATVGAPIGGPLGQRGGEEIETGTLWGSPLECGVRRPIRDSEKAPLGLRKTKDPPPGEEGEAAS